MSRIRLSLVNANGQAERVHLHEAKDGAEPLRAQVQAGQMIFVQVDGQQQTGQIQMLGKRPVLKRSGKDLIVEVEGEAVIQLGDFYAAAGASLNGDAWDFAADQDLQVTAQSVVATGGADLAAVGTSGTNRDLAAVGMSGTNQDLAAVGMSGTNRDLAAVGMSGTGLDLAAVGMSGTNRDLAAVGVSGTGTGTNTDLAAVGMSGTGRDLAAVGMSGTGRDLAAVGITGTGVNSLMAGISLVPFLQNLGGGDGSESDSSVLNGSVVAGPVGGGLKVLVYKLSGGKWVKLEGEAIVQPGGGWTFNVKDYKGPVVVKVVDDNGDSPNYTSELTGQPVDINATMMTVMNVSPGVSKVQVNPLTTIAALTAGLEVDASGSLKTTAPAGLDVATVNASNNAVAKAFGISDIVKADVVTLVTANGDANIGANTYGKILAAIEGAGGNSTEELQKMASGVSTTGSQPALSIALQEQLVSGIAVVAKNLVSDDPNQPNPLADLVTEMANNLNQASSSTEVSIGTVTKDNAIDEDEKGQTISVTVSTPLNVTSLTALILGQSGVSVNVSGGSGNWTVSFSASGLDYGGYTLEVTAGELKSVRTFAVRDTVAPNAPGVMLANDRGVSDSDGITDIGMVNVLNLEVGAIWEYRTNNGATWTQGKGTSFELPLGSYAAGAVQVRQYDKAGNVSEVGTSSKAITIVRPADLDQAGSVSISGTAQEDQTLTASTVTDLDGGVTGVTYQWMAGGVAISGATGNSYTLTQAEVGKVITVMAFYSDANGSGKSVTSAPTVPVVNIDDAATGTLSVEGQAQEGGTLTASLTNVLDADGSTTTAYCWEENINGTWTAISGQSSASLVIPSDQSYVGKSVRVVATTTDALGGSTVFTGQAQMIVNVDDAGSISAITGTATQGATLTAGAISDADGAVTGISYQWKANGNVISGATGSQYTLTQADVGKVITVAATYTDDFGTTSTVTSEETGAVTDLIAPFFVSATISGADSNGVAKSGVLKTNDIIRVVLTSSEALTGWNEGHSVGFNVDAGLGTAAYFGSTGNEHTFEYRVQSGDSVSVATLSLVSGLSGLSGLLDLANNALSTSQPLQSVWLDSTLSVDAVAPLLTAVELTAAREGNNIHLGALRAGDVITLKASYNEAVVGQLTEAPSLWIGEEEKAWTPAITAGNARSWTYIVTESDDGMVFMEGDLLEGLADAAGNPADVSPNFIERKNSFVVDQWVTSAAVTAVHDNAGLLQGVVAHGGQTDDTQLFISGTVEAGWTDGDEIKVYDGETYLGDAKLGSDSISWSFVDTRTLVNGYVANYSVQVVDWANNESEASDPYTVTVSVSLGATINVTANASPSGVSGTMADSGIADSPFSGLNSITGTAGNDSIKLSNSLTVSALALLGMAGDDTFNIAGAISGTASIDGGAGNDSIVLSGQSSGTFTISGGDGNDSFTFSSSSAGSYTLLGGEGNDSIDVSAVTSAGLYADGGAGEDNIVMGAGNDTVVMNGAGDDTFIGGGGVDVLTGASETTAMTISITAANATSGADGIVRSGGFTGGDSFWGFESIVGGSGNDIFTISASTSLSVSLTGGEGNDRFIFSSNAVGAYTLTGGDGDDSVDASTSAAAVLYVTDGSGIDTVRMGGGNDTVFSSEAGGGDSFTGGSGTDVLSHAALTAAMAISITAATSGGGATGTVTAAAGGTADSFAGFESIVGGSGNDTFNISANISNVTVNGGVGNDNMVSTSSLGVYVVDGGGADTVTLGSGNDTVYSGAESTAGNDSFIGGAGTDLLSYAAQSVALTISITAANSTSGVNGTAQSASGTGTDVFSGFESITAGSGNDTFVVTDCLGQGITLNGGSGSADVLNFAAQTVGLTVSVTTSGGTVTTASGGGTDSFSGFERFVLGSGSDVFTAANSTLSFHVTDGNGVDTIIFGSGNDTVIGAVGAFTDSFTGGAGTDLLDYGAQTMGLTVSVTASSGTVTSAAVEGADSFSGFERFVLGSGSDVFTVANSTIHLYVADGGGADTVVLGVGNDTVYAGAESLAGNDSFTGGAGTDLLSYAAQSAALTISITAANSTSGVNGSVQSASGTGTDLFNGFESIVGGSGSDSILFSALSSGQASISAGAGNDSISFNGVTTGSFSIDGGAGNDSISLTGLSGGNFTFVGGDGNDTISISGNSPSSISILMGAGDDIFNMSGVTSYGGITLNETGANAAGNDTFVFGSGNDTINIQDAQTNSLTTGSGSDKIKLMALNQTSNGGGLGVQTITDFNWNNDELSLSGFWSAGTVTSTNLSQYVQMNGSNLQVDLDGNDSAYTWTTVANMAGQTNFVSLANHFNDEFKVIA